MPKTLNAAQQERIISHNKEIDKLKGRSTESEYDRFYQTLRDQITDITIRLEQLQEADDNHYITTKHLLELSSKAYELFKSSEVEEKRQLIKLVLSNLSLKDENLDYELISPFDAIAKCSEEQVWRPLLYMFQNQELEFEGTSHNDKALKFS